MNTPRFLRAAVLIIFSAIALEARAQVNLLTNGSFEDDGTTIHAATSLTGWNVGVRNVGYYSDLTAIGTGVDNLAGSVDVANFHGTDLGLGGTPTTSAAYDGTHFVDLIGAVQGEANHSQQNLNGVLYQAVTGLSSTESYILQFRYSTTGYAGTSPRRLGIRIDLVDNLGNKVSEIYNAFEDPTLSVGLLPTDPAGVKSLDDMEFFGPGGPSPFDYDTLPGGSLNFLDSRTIAPNAISSTPLTALNVYDHVVGNADSTTTTRWQTLSHEFSLPAGPHDSIRISFWNDTHPKINPAEADYHWNDTTDEVWFSNQVGILLDDVFLIPEPSGALLFFVGGALFLLRRGRRKTRP